MGTIRRRLRVGLEFTTLTDETRFSTVDAVTTASPTSPLYASSPAIQATVTSLGKRGTDLKAATVLVNNDKGKLLADTSSETEKRTDFDNDLRTLVTLTQNGAIKPGDITALGLPYLPPVTKQKLAPDVPTGATAKYPVKGHSKAWAVAEYSGKGRPQFNAEMSLDGLNWTALVGHGKQRTLTGASGTKIWVRFATVRGEMQSAWCTPVILTIP